MPHGSTTIYLGPETRRPLSRHQRNTADDFLSRTEQLAVAHKVWKATPGAQNERRRTISAAIAEFLVLLKRVCAMATPGSASLLAPNYCHIRGKMATRLLEDAATLAANTVYLTDEPSDAALTDVITGIHNLLEGGRSPALTGRRPETTPDLAAELACARGEAERLRTCIQTLNDGICKVNRVAKTLQQKLCTIYIPIDNGVRIDATTIVDYVDQIALTARKAVAPTFTDIRTNSCVIAAGGVGSPAGRRSTNAIAAKRGGVANIDSGSPLTVKGIPDAPPRIKRRSSAALLPEEPTAKVAKLDEVTYTDSPDGNVVFLELDPSNGLPYYECQGCKDRFYGGWSTPICHKCSPPDEDKIKMPALSTVEAEAGALLSLDRFKYTFEDQPKVYADFIDLMQGYKRGSVTFQVVITRATELLKEHPALIAGLSEFLPAGYKIPEPVPEPARPANDAECDPDDPETWPCNECGQVGNLDGEQCGGCGQTVVCHCCGARPTTDGEDSCNTCLRAEEGN